MRKGNVTMLASVLAIALVATVIGAGTMAFFNETVQATGNTFTAGNLDIKLSSTGTGGWTSSPIAGYWSTPTNWAPGESTTPRRIWFKNFGNVPVQVVLLDFKNYQVTSGPSSFWNVIEVDYFDETYSGSNVASAIATFIGDNTVPLTLHEIIATPNSVPGYVDNCDLILFDIAKPACPACVAAGYPNTNLLGGTYLAPGQVGYLELGFKFSSSASSAYEGAIASFDLQMSFIQGPDSGVCRHELPGFFP